MKLLIPIIFALSLTAQRIEIKITDAAGVVTNAKITGPKAGAYLESMTAWMATQQDCVQVPGTTAVLDAQGNVTMPAVAPSQACTPQYSSPAELIKSHVVTLAGQTEASHPSTGDKVDQDKIKADQVALENKRKARAEAALKEK